MGLALSDTLRVVATPLETLDHAKPKETFRKIRELVESQTITTVVIGLPLHMDGGRGDLARAAEDFAAKLRRQLPKTEILLWDERLSSAEAERVLRQGGAKASRRKEMRDQLAAQLILQSWLDARVEGLEG